MDCFVNVLLFQRIKFRYDFHSPLIRKAETDWMKAPEIPGRLLSIGSMDIYIVSSETNKCLLILKFMHVLLLLADIRVE